jgi:hypothetical protein
MTRCTINFCENNNVYAKIYRHSDGYPESILPDLKEFFETVKKETDDHRFHHAEYLAAKFVVWQARQFSRPSGSLDFISVGVCMEDPGDIAHTYFVNCDKITDEGYPQVDHKKV